MKLEMMEPVVKKFYEGLAEGKFYARKCRECGVHRRSKIEGWLRNCDACGRLRTGLHR